MFKFLNTKKLFIFQSNQYVALVIIKQIFFDSKHSPKGFPSARVSPNAIQFHLCHIGTNPIPHGTSNGRSGWELFADNPRLACNKSS